MQLPKTVVRMDLPEHGGKSGSEQKSGSSRTRTSILVAANTRAGGVASMGFRAVAKATIARSVDPGSAHYEYARHCNRSVG